MSSSRRCTKTSCPQPAVATLTYAYAERAVVVGPLATFAEPHTYDLCADHASRMTAPRGWEVMRLSPEGYVVVTDTDDLLAVVDAVRETSRRPAARSEAGAAPVGLADLGSRPAPPDARQRAHLRVVQGEGGGSA